jgi:hypothetical protein
MSLNIRSRDGASIVLAEVNSSRLRVTLAGHGVQGENFVWFHRSPGLTEFFRDLAAHWNGWKGPKTWESDEGELSIEATTNRLGRVTLRTVLHTDVDPVWRLQLSLLVEAGQLDAIARDVAAFEQALVAAA